MPKVTPTTVLCVDDDPRAMMARSLVLSIAGYDVRTATSSEAALSIFRRFPADLVIADYFLPGINGTELAGLMRKIKPDVRVVLLMVAVEAPRRAEQVDLILFKGMHPQEFLHDIEILLGRKERKAAAGTRLN